MGRKVGDYVYWTADVCFAKADFDQITTIFNDMTPMEPRDYYIYTEYEIVAGVQISVTFEELKQLIEHKMLYGIAQDYRLPTNTPHDKLKEAGKEELTHLYGSPVVNRVYWGTADEAIYGKSPKVGIDVHDICHIAMIAAIWEYRHNDCKGSAGEVG